MTLVVMRYDAAAQCLGAAAMTGNLCVGGWVLRGRYERGITASMGQAASTRWGEQALERLQHVGAAEAVAATVAPDPGRALRQLAVLDTRGDYAHFSGADNVAHTGALQAGPHLVIGNMLAGAAVLEAAMQALQEAADSDTPMAQCLQTALQAAHAAGGDYRGLMSAALLVLAPDVPPLDLRVDYAEAPLPALQDLYQRTQAPAYQQWLAQVPCPLRPCQI